MQKVKLISRIALKVEYLLLWYFSVTAKWRRCRKKTKRLLIARTDGLGDYIIWKSVSTEIRKLYPDMKIVMMLDDTKPTSEIAKHDRDIDEVINIGIHSRQRFLSIFKVMKMKYDLVIQPVYSRLAFTDILLFAMHADRRITIDTNGQLLSEKEWKLTNRGYDEILHCSKGVHHELIRCAELIRGLGAEEYKVSYPKLMYKGDKEQLGKYILVFPSASYSGKVWKKEKFSELLKWILLVVPYRIFLCGDDKDAVICDFIVEQLQNERVVSMAGKDSLSDTVNRIGNALYVIGNDTGAMHIAVACNVPVAVIVADREIGRFFPYETECMEEHNSIVVIDAELSCRRCLINGKKECMYQQEGEDALFCIDSICVERVKGKLMMDYCWTRLMES